MAKRRRHTRKSAGLSKALHELGRYKALARMIGGFVHQLRTPIHIIQSSAEDIAAQPRFLPKFKPQAEMIARSAGRLEDSVRALLEFVKGGKPRLERGSLKDIVFHLLGYLKEETRLHKVAVDQELRAERAVKLDPYSLQEALLNLLTNALQAMPRGGRLLIRTEDAPAGKVTLRIADTGRGMDAAQLKRLAVPFQTTKRRGMGLGVFFTRKILDQHRAALRFASQKGKGTTVTIVFPAASAKP